MRNDVNKGSPRQLTVAHLMPWSGMGGVEIATLRLVAATRDRCRHIAFCMDDAADLRSGFEAQGIETVTYVPPEPSLRHLLRFYAQSRAVARELRARNVDIVHFADIKAAQHNSLAARLARCRTVCHVRVSNTEFSRRDRILLKPVDSFIFVSQEARQSFGLPVPKSGTRVIYDAFEPPAVDAEANRVAVRAEFGLPANAPIVGMIARVSRQKDYMTLADAAVLVLRTCPETQFMVVGDNSLVNFNREHYAEVSRRLQDLGIADRFLFTGHRTDVPRLTSAMDVCVLCTHREGFPLSILEAMSMGKPMIATSVGGIPEIVQHNVTGCLHAHEDSGELAREIITLLSDPAEARRLGENGQQHVRTHYAIDTFAQHIQEAYVDVAR